MKKIDLLTITGNYWHFHLIGTGTVFTYDSKAKQVLISCAATGSVISIVDKFQDNEEYKTPQEFKKASTEIYLTMASENSISMDLSFYENSKTIGNSMIEVDFDLMKN